MKVDHTRPAYGTQGTYGVDASAPRSGNQVATGTPSDTLNISGDVELAARAMAAAAATPDIRPEAVARGRAAIAKGVDVDALSDAMVSHLLESWRME
jgi:hypothetical protein